MIFRGVEAGGHRDTVVAMAVGAIWMAVAAVFAPAAAAEEAAGSPAMWQITDEDTTLILFGTLHLLPSETGWQTASFDKAMTSTKHTIIEADVESPEAKAQAVSLIRKYGLNPPDVTLSDTLGKEGSAQFKAVADKFGLSMAMLEKMRPWLALLTVTQAAYAQAGFDPTQGVETVVLDRARKEGDEVGYLESLEIQIKALASLDKSEMLENLEVSLDEFKDFKTSANQMLEAWRTGDVETLDKLITADLRKEAPGAYQTLIVMRNKAWAEQIARIMAGEGTHFIAVGAGHLVGKDSVIDMLEKAGFKTKRIQ